MRHANTQTIFDFWRTRGSPGDAADCAPVDAGRLGDLFPRLFVIERMDRDHHVFVMAGKGLCAIHQRSMEGQNLLALWRGADRIQMTGLLEGAIDAAAPAFALTEAKAMNGRAMAVELSIFPLNGRSGGRTRCLGLYQPLMGRSLGDRPAVHHALRESKRGRPAEPPRACAANDL